MTVDHLIDLQPGEKVLYSLRRHWIIFFGDLAMIAILALVPIGVYVMLSLLWKPLLYGPISRPSLILLTSGYYLMIWLFFIATFVDYYLDAWVVTNERIVNVEQRGLFSRTISELDLARIQDVTSEVKGIIPSIFSYGDVYIQTAGEVERFDFEEIPHPHEIRKHLLEVVEQDQKRKTAAGASTA